MNINEIELDKITSDELSKFDFSSYSNLLVNLDGRTLTDVEKIVILGIIKRLYGGNKFPHVEIYLKNTQAGELIEKIIEGLFNDITRVTNQNYDIVVDKSGLRIEVKSIRVMSSKNKDKFPVHRAMSIFDKQTCLSNTSFQQIKPSEFDLMVGVLVYKDALSIYVVPSSAFHPIVIKKTDNANKPYIKELNDAGKIVLSGQHKNNLTEGQIGFNELKKYIRFSIYSKGGSYYYIENGKKTNKPYSNLEFTDFLPFW